jgi:transcriptional regulator with XRE-family HTH domain
MSDSPSFGDWMRRQRKERDLTQDAFAEQIGCSVQMIRKVETGTARPSRPLADLLVAHLAVPAGARPAFVEWARGGPAPAGSADVPAPPPPPPVSGFQG